MFAGVAPIRVIDIAEDSDPTGSETGGDAKSPQSNSTFLPAHSAPFNSGKRREIGLIQQAQAQITPAKSALHTFSGSRRSSENATAHQAVSGRSKLPHVSGGDDAGSLTGFPSGRTLYLAAESIVFRAERNQTVLAVYLLTFGSRATVAFIFALEAPFNVAHRLICACRMRSRPSALILWRFLDF
jgi:hypothetical protein